jgi:TonB-dependent SusC/RagA subfamily outer membrane receptor
LLKGIPVQSVKSINVLKGAEASIYGVRGSNGVILVTLKTN